MTFTKSVILFIILNFIISFLSDIILNDLSTNYNVLKSLRVYFKGHSIIKTAIDAGITVLFALFINMYFSYILFGFMLPYNYVTLLKFCIMAFIIGYLLDTLIYKLKIFGNRLNNYYINYGIGFWGSIAFLFSIIMSYIIQKYICLLC